MTDYQQTIDYLYRQLPMYQKIGNAAVKKDLHNIQFLCENLGQPQLRFPSIHVAGTNGKGTITHLLAAAFQSAGYKVGCYTSPHYIDFRERVKVNGKWISEAAVVKFVQKYFKPMASLMEASFFEISVAMAFWYFDEEGVDIAIVETGLGGRLDSTNILIPRLSIISNISFDHMSFLGSTIHEIAWEKAGIIKEKIPVVIGKKDEDYAMVFRKAALERSAPLYFTPDYVDLQLLDQGIDFSTLNAVVLGSNWIKELRVDSGSPFVAENVATTLMSLLLLQEEFDRLQQWHLVSEGISHFKEITNYIGRWEILCKRPLCIADSGHNIGAWKDIFLKLRSYGKKKWHVVLGMMKEKNPQEFLIHLPIGSRLYLASPDIPRAMASEELSELAKGFPFDNVVFGSLWEAYQTALQNAASDDLIYLGGSSFVVGEIMSHSEKST